MFFDDPKSWRVAQDLTATFVAKRVGITGKNPGATYIRYENGEQPCPADIVEKVRELSNHAIGAEAWQKVRVEYLRRAGHDLSLPSMPVEAATAGAASC